MKSSDLINLCGWNIDCLVNSLAVVLVNVARGSVPRDLIERSVFANKARCLDNDCMVDVHEIDVKELISTLGSEVFREAYSKAISILTLNELRQLINSFVELNIENISKIVHKITDIKKDDLNSGFVSEQIGTLLYLDENYEDAEDRFREAKMMYENFGLNDRAKFMEAFIKVARAEALKNKALKLHEENRHEDEEKLIKEAAKLYAESSVIFHKIQLTIPEARVNYLLSKSDSVEVLANYYFTHGQTDEAEKYYTMCYNELRQLSTLDEEYQKILNLKRSTCLAFAKLCKAINTGEMTYYEEAADEFSKLVEEGYLEDVMIETAMIAYRGALDSAKSIDDVLRIYPKYLRFVSKYIDLKVKERYENFENMISELKRREMDSVSKELGVDEYAFKIYLAYKALEKAYIDEKDVNINPLELMTYIAGLGMDPIGINPEELIQDMRSAVEELPEEIERSVTKLINRMNKYLTDWLFTY